jgi:uncharacterized protein
MHMDRKTFFSAGEEYLTEVREYKQKDGFYALGLYLVLLILYYFMGVLQGAKNIYLGYQVNLFLALLVICLTLIRRQSLRSIGICKRNLGKSLLLGLIPSVILLTVMLIIGFVGGGRLAGPITLMGDFLYYLFIIGFVEELLFRSYIQTRIYGLIHNSILAVIITGILFMLMHIPFQMGAARMGILEYIGNNYITLLFTFLWHIVFRFLYAKYNHILAPTIFHTVLNWSGSLFR